MKQPLRKPDLFSLVLGVNYFNWQIAGARLY